jgi:hypothetical protein
MVRGGGVALLKCLRQTLAFLVADSLIYIQVKRIKTVIFLNLSAERFFNALCYIRIKSHT